MERQKVHLEYLLNATSKSILWTAISTPSGLEGWFADRVQSDNKHVTFFWGKTEKREADIVALRAYSFIRFNNHNHKFFNKTIKDSKKKGKSNSARRQILPSGGET